MKSLGAHEKNADEYAKPIKQIESKNLCLQPRERLRDFQMMKSLSPVGTGRILDG
jgi:hypothetical protein